MSKRMEKPVVGSDRPDERTSELARRTKGLEVHHARRADLARAIPPAAVPYVQGIDPKANLLRLKSALALRIPNMAEARRVFAEFEPIRLVQVRFDVNNNHTLRGLTQIWPVTFEPRNYTVTARTDVAPFLYVVSQGQGYGPIRQLFWASKLGKEEVLVQAQIDDAPGTFKTLTTSYTSPGRMEVTSYKLVPGYDFPNGPRFGSWGRWCEGQMPDTTCTTYWPLEHFAERGFISIAQLAHISLLCKAFGLPLDPKKEVGLV